MNVPFNYLPYQFKETKNIFNDWSKLIKSSEFTLGPYVEKFEKNFSKFIGSKFCISTNTGTDALILSLKSLGVKKGDEVITVCNTFYATVGAIVACDAKPVFVDAQSNFQMDVSQVERLITKKTKVIVPVHWAGGSPDMDELIKISKKYKIPILEDACMGIGAKVNGSSPGTFGKISAFSMHPLKSLNVMGDGGIIVTDSKSIYTWLKKYRNHGMISRDRIDIWGINSRLQPLQAVVANHQLKNITTIIKKRNQNALRLDDALSDSFFKDKITLPKRTKNNKEAYALYMGLFKKRDQLIKFLNKSKIEAKIHYRIPLHLQKPSIDLGYRKGSFPVAEDQAKKLITLPVHQYLSESQIDYMVDKIRLFYKN